MKDYSIYTAIYVGGPAHGRTECLTPDQLHERKIAVHRPIRVAEFDYRKPIDEPMGEIATYTAHRTTFGSVVLMTPLDMDADTAMRRVFNDFLTFGRIQEAARKDPRRRSILERLKDDTL